MSFSPFVVLLKRRKPEGHLPIKGTKLFLSFRECKRRDGISILTDGRLLSKALRHFKRHCSPSIMAFVCSAASIVLECDN